jgi:hypothetical protein
VPVSTAVERVVTVTNSGGLPLTITNRNVPGPFDIVDGETTCNAATILAPGGTCVITMTVFINNSASHTRNLTVSATGGTQLNYTVEVSATTIP